MTELKHLGNRRRLPWRPIIIYSLIVIAFLWMSNRDWEQMQDNRALVEVVATQQAVIEGMQCDGDLQMGMPIEKVQM